MITIRLLGGARKAVGRSSVGLDRANVSVEEILQFLTSVSIDGSGLQKRSLIVAINGVDSAALQGQQTIAKSGDIVTIVTVVHGGADYIIDGNHILIVGLSKTARDPGTLVHKLRAKYQGLSIQVVNANAAYGTDHVLGILRMALESEKRKIMIAKSRETEILVRLACTSQISDAIERVGLKINSAGCLIAISKDHEELRRFYERIKDEFETDDSVLAPNTQKRTGLAGMLGLEPKFRDKQFLQYLLERAAILSK